MQFSVALLHIPFCPLVYNLFQLHLGTGTLCFKFCLFCYAQMLSKHTDYALFSCLLCYTHIIISPTYGNSDALGPHKDSSLPISGFSAILDAARTGLKAAGYR